MPSVLCLICGTRGAADGILNALLFMPLGFALLHAMRGRQRAAVAIVALTVTIELLQGMIPGRYQTLADVVYNTLGGIAGIGLAALGASLFRPSRAMGRALTLATGAGAAAVFTVTGALLTPSFPATLYYGQWTADLHYMAAYEGQVLEASLGSMPLPSWRVSDAPAAVALMRAGAPLTTRAVAGPAPPGLAPIVSILDESRVEIVVLGADRADLVLRLRYRANDVRLDRPDLRVRGALASVSPGDTITLRAEGIPGAYALTLDGESLPPLRHTPGEGWALLMHPEQTPPWMDRALAAGWVAAPMVLAGWWAPGIAWATAALLLAMGGMTGAAAAGPVTSVAAGEVLAALLGVVLGVALRRTIERGRTMPLGGASVPRESAKNRPVLTTGVNSGDTDG
jgi:hypothetical protein